MTEIAATFGAVLAQLAPFLLLGFAVAGLLHGLVPAALLAKAMGGSGIGSITRAALIGVPLPLCSCGVIPVAVELRNRGASRGATTAFLVSTPETGVDSIAASVAVLHPLMVVVRPIAALVTAIIAGLAVENLTRGPVTAAKSDHDCCHGPTESTSGGAKGLRGGMRYAFVDLFAEVAVYLLPALLVTALLTVLLEPGVMSQYLPSRPLQMLVLLVTSIPIYVCASAATPIAAGLIATGFSPGAALVFLLAGPATNLVTIAAATRTLGKSGAGVYLGSVALLSLLFGAVLDQLCDWLQIVPAAAPTTLHEHLTWVHWTSAVVVGVLLLFHFGRRWRSRRAA